MEYYDVQHEHSLKIDVISDWLHLQVHQPSLPYYRTLEIGTLCGEVLVVHLESVEQLIETLKMVSLNILLILSFPPSTVRVRVELK